ncbi:MAG: hypothetical protein ACYCWW_06975, partial [Deltaproteobacteria bacterium]
SNFCGGQSGPCCSNGGTHFCTQANSVCTSGAIQFCEGCGGGGASNACCVGNFCAGGGCCEGGGCIANGQKCFNNQTCTGGSCGGCGGLDQPACAGGATGDYCTGPSTVALNGTCYPCGGQAQPCCADGSCGPPFSCDLAAQTCR